MTADRPIIVTTYAEKPWRGLTPEELDQLAMFNAEVARGIVHTQEHVGRMSVLQARFDSGVPGPDRETPSLWPFSSLRLLIGRKSNTEGAA